MPSAYTSTLKPAGTFSLSSGSSLAGRPVRIGAIGCSVELLCSADRPCCHEGAGAGAAGACAPADAASTSPAHKAAVLAKGYLLQRLVDTVIAVSPACCDREQTFCRESEPEHAHRVRAADGGAFGRCELGGIGESAFRVVYPVRPVGAEHHMVGADDGDEVAQGAQVVGDVVVVDVAQVVGRLSLHLP